MSEASPDAAPDAEASVEDAPAPDVPDAPEAPASDMAPAEADGADESPAEAAEGVAPDDDAPPREDAPSAFAGDEPSDPTKVGTEVIDHPAGDAVVVQEGETSAADVEQRVQDDWRLAQEQNKDNVDPLGRFH